MAQSYETWVAKLASDEGKSEEAFIKSVLLETAKTAVKKYEMLWLKALNAKNKTLRDSIVRNENGEVTEKFSVPDNYWKAEHEAHARFQNACELLKAIEAS